MQQTARTEFASENVQSPSRPDTAPRPMEIRLNPQVAEMAIDQPSEGRRKIVFVHVGKCAGGSIINSLRSAMSDHFIMYELHCFNANLAIRDIIARDRGDLSYLVSTRDPVSRFISSYNWDKHNIYLSNKALSPSCGPLFEQFSSVDELALALGSDDPETADRALDFAGFGHMGMGPAWYTPLDVVKALPYDRTYLCQSEHLSRDLQKAVTKLDPEAGERQLEIGRDKSNFAAGYENAETLFSTYLSDQARRNLRILLNEDIRVHRLLRQRFGAHRA